VKPAEGDALPGFLATLVVEQPDDRPVPALGLGDQDAAIALLAATRAVLLAGTATDVVTAVARFSLGMGGVLVLASQDAGTAIPLDITLGDGVPVLVDAEVFSISRMRLEQFLPTLVEDARCAVSRLRHLNELERASTSAPDVEAEVGGCGPHRPQEDG
jgi:hypothetical protein